MERSYREREKDNTGLSIIFATLPDRPIRIITVHAGQRLALRYPPTTVRAHGLSVFHSMSLAICTARGKEETGHAVGSREPDLCPQEPPPPNTADRDGRDREEPGMPYNLGKRLGRARKRTTISKVDIYITPQHTPGNFFVLLHADPGARTQRATECN